MKRMPLLCALAFACGPQTDQQPRGDAFEPTLMVPNPEEEPELDATAAALTAVGTVDFVADIGQFIEVSFGLQTMRSGGVLTGQGNSAFNFQGGGASCQSSFSFARDAVSLERGCTLPSGRHVSGSLSLSRGAVCAPWGLSLQYSFVIESQPGAGDEVYVQGTADLAFGVGELYFDLDTVRRITVDGHTLEHVAAGCFMLDRRSRLVAMNGVVSTSVDGTTVRSFEVDDLQRITCEAIPYTGRIRYESFGRHIQVAFSRTTAGDGVVDVEVDGHAVDIDLSAGIAWIPGEHLCAVDAPVTPPVLDYDACGGCGGGGGGGGSQPPPGGGAGGTPGGPDVPDDGF